MPPLNRGGNIIPSPDEITDPFASHNENTSKDSHKKSEQGKTEIRGKKKNYHKNNLHTKLKAATNQKKNTAPGEDTIYPQMIKKMLSETLKNLLDMYNKI